MLEYNLVIKKEIQEKREFFWLPRDLNPDRPVSSPILLNKMMWKLCTVSHFRSKRCIRGHTCPHRLKYRLKMSALRSYIRFL